jgi:HK97 gp10 family phage protein
MSLGSSRYGANLRIDTRDVQRFEKNLKKFEHMTVKKRRDAMAQVAKYALKDTKQAMVANANKIRRSGTLAKSITSATFKRTGFGSVAGARTGPVIRGKSSRRAFHAHLVELGTKKKRKTVKPGKGAFKFYGRRTRRWVVTKSIHHGSQAKPYIAPAWEKTKNKVRTRMRKKMKTILDNLKRDFPK